MPELDRLTRSTSSRRSTPSGEASIMFSFFDRARQQTVFDGSEERARQALRKAFGMNPMHTLYQCEHRFDLDDWWVYADKTVTLTDNIRSSVINDIQDRKRSEGLPSQCSNRWANNVWSGAYIHQIFASRSMKNKDESNIKTDYDEDAEIILTVELGSKVNANTVVDTVEQELAYTTERGMVKRPILDGKDSIFERLYMDIDPSQGVWSFCLGSHSPVDLAWSFKVVSDLKRRLGEVTKMEYKAYPNSNWDKRDECGKMVKEVVDGFSSKDTIIDGLSDSDNGDENPYEDADFEDVFPQDENNEQRHY